MAHLNHAAAYQELRDKVLAGINDHFPIQGKLKSLSLEGVAVHDEHLGSDDIDGQKAAKLDGSTWSVPVYATMRLTDNATGRIIDRKTMRIAEIPKVTRRHSFILDGQEYQLANQWQLKPGAYVRRKQTGELETQFNIAGRPPFNITFDPESKRFLMERGSSKAIPLYPIMRALGVDDTALEKEWGKEIFAANRSVRGMDTALDRFYRADKKVSPQTPEAARDYMVEALGRSELRPDATERTLGKPFSFVNGDTLASATAKMLKVQAGAPEDDRDSLTFKDLRSTADYVHDKLTHWKTKADVRAKVSRKINFADSVRDVVKFDMFNAPIRNTFSHNSLASTPKQINPVEMLSSAMQTTVMGEGGIQRDEQINDEVKFVNPSHLGFLDPIHTPESDRTGVVLHLPIGIQKDQNTAKLPLYNIATGKTELVSPSKFLSSKVVLPDQVTWRDGKPVPIAHKVQMSSHDNKLTEDTFGSAQYVMQHPSQLFGVASNLIPFLNNNSGNRATYATAHISQAVSLQEREAPLVMVGTGSKRPGRQSFEELIGRQSGHPALSDGTVTKVTSKSVTIKGTDGKSHTVQLYNNFPLNDPKAVLHSTPIVQVGDKVEAGQTVADTNFMKDGKLALGRNLRVAYVPFKGYNFEDGVVISEEAAKKLSSLHLHKPSLMVDDQLVMSPKKFKVQHPSAFTREQYQSVGDDGIVRVGTKVQTGDPLVVAMRPYQLKDRMGLGAISKSLSGHHSDVSLRWESDHPGEVVGTSKDRWGRLTVHVKTVEPMQLGDKIAGRHGNKGIVSMILPEHEMPKTKDGKSIEVVLNPSGVPGRINIGQVLETAAAKIAKKTGKPYIVDNFNRDDAVARVKSELKQHGLSDTEELHDPVTGVNLGKALVGPQYMLKLTHQIDKKISARAGMGLPGAGGDVETYDRNLMPAGGGKTGGQRMDPYTINVLLAHGARANIREAQTWKSEGPDPQSHAAKQWPSQHIAVWKAIQESTPIPLPRATFAFQKFTDMLRASGINVEKKGHTFQLSPMTDRQILSMSSGELPKPNFLTEAKLDKNGEPKPKAGGLFDPQLTGGHGGRKWSHIKLAEPIPNPVFESAIRGVLGITTKQYEGLVSGEHAVTKSGSFVTLGTAGSMTGGVAIKHMLDKVNVKDELEEVQKKLGSLVKQKGVDASGVDSLVKRTKYLQALDQLKVKPSEAYVLHNLPVIPPVMRPASVLPNGGIRWADINGLYQTFAQINQQLADPVLRKNLTDVRLKKLRSDLYDGVQAIMGSGTVKEGDRRGFLAQIHGSTSKEGYFQRTLMDRRQDLSMRSVIVPEPALGLDEVGLPTKKALTLYRPFVVRKLVEMGSAATPLEAQEMIKKDAKPVQRALELVAQERPVILKRDPALHKHSALAFTPRLVSGRAIQIHPLVTSGFNADFDGDTMSAYVPVSRDAVDEARRMFPSNNLFNEATGKVMYQPTLESALGLYKLSVVGSGKHKSFATPADALRAVQDKSLSVSAPVSIGSMKTTAGRLLLADALPEQMRDDVLKGSEPIDKKQLDRMFTRIAKDHAGEFGAIANRLKDLGNGMSFGAVEVKHPNHRGPTAIIAKEDPRRHVQFVPTGTHTLSLDDFAADKATRDPIFNQAQHSTDALDRMNLTSGERERRTIDIWKKAAQEVEQQHREKISKDPSNLAIMQIAGVKPSWDQYKQMVLAPVLVTDSSNRVIPRPIKRSYSEGLGVGDYWTQMSGARRGTVMKVQEVRDPGALSKQLVASAVNLVVTGHDCGTSGGIGLPVSSGDLHDRVLARDFSAKGVSVPAGTILSPDVINKIRAADRTGTLLVRSPLKCEHGTGLCQKCAGLAPNGRFYDVGTNTGLLAAQSLGERSVQVTLKSFHSGGVVSSGGHQVTDDFTRIEQLTQLPKPNRKSPDVAVLAMHSGKVTKIEKDATGAKVWVGDQPHHVGKDRHGRLLSESLPNIGIVGQKVWESPQVGATVQAGQSLTDPNRTLINPHDLYRATKSMDRVQTFLTDELHGIYGREGVRRQHVETIVKALGNLTKVRDPGDAEGILPGEFQPYSRVRAINVELVKAGKRPIEHTPKLKGVKMLPFEIQEDWMAKLQHNNLRATLMDAAATGAVSNIHGLHPVPGAAFGAEFGMTQTHATRPGLEHLRHVPAYAY